MFDRCPNGVAIGIRLPTPQSAVRCASEFDYLRDRQIDLGVAVLINGRDPTRDVAAFPVGQRGSVQGHDTGRRTIVPASSFSSVDFPEPLGPRSPTVLPVVARRRGRRL